MFITCFCQTIIQNQNQYGNQFNKKVNKGRKNISIPNSDFWNGGATEIFFHNVTNSAGSRYFCSVKVYSSAEGQSSPPFFKPVSLLDDFGREQ